MSHRSVAMNGIWASTRRSMTGARIKPYFMAADDVVDVDGMRDLQLARLIMEDVS